MSRAHCRKPLTAGSPFPGKCRAGSFSNSDKALRDTPSAFAPSVTVNPRGRRMSGMDLRGPLRASLDWRDKAKTLLVLGQRVLG